MNIEVYSREHCNYCALAKNLLQSIGYPYTEHKLGQSFTRESLMETFPNAKTYPVIVIDGFNIGGFNELARFVEAVQFTNLNDKQLLNEE